MFWLKKFVSFWLLPLPFSLALFAAGWWLTRSARGLRAGRALVLIGIAWLTLLGNHTVSYWLAGSLERRYPAVPELAAGAPLPAELATCRYVVVLGGGNGHSPGRPALSELSFSSLARITEGVRLLRALPSARLLVSGPGIGAQPTHATVLTRAAISLGIDADRIDFIDRARDTEEEAQLAAAKVGRAPVALVTSAWHMPRAMALFRRAGVTALACPADFSAQTDEAFEWTKILWDMNSLHRSHWALRERLGSLWLRLRGET